MTLLTTPYPLVFLSPIHTSLSLALSSFKHHPQKFLLSLLTRSPPSFILSLDSLGEETFKNGFIQKSSPRCLSLCSLCSQLSCVIKYVSSLLHPSHIHLLLLHSPTLACDFASNCDYAQRPFDSTKRSTCESKFLLGWGQKI